jgi:protein involved in polysaccharide export with SLBB domain
MMTHHSRLALLGSAIRSILATVGLAVCAVTASSEPAVAQTTAAQAAVAQARGRADATRAELLAEVRDAEAAVGIVGISAAEHGRLLNEISEKRTRLADGDLRVGDRILLEVLRPLNLVPGPDTVVVDTGETVTLPVVGVLSLKGALRSELDDRVRAALALQVVDPKVRVRMLMTVLLTGAVTRQGPVSVNPDALLRDAITQGGGVAPTADLARISVRRANTLVYHEGDLQKALTQGATLDQLGVRSGDEIQIALRKVTSRLTVMQSSAAILTVLLGLYGAARVIR